MIMINETHFTVLKEIIKTYLPEDVLESDIRADSNFISELNINSANLVDIVLDVEDAYTIKLENEDMNEMHTVTDALNIIARKLADKNP